MGEYGVYMESDPSTLENSHNTIWGNRYDYWGDISASPQDFSVDPQLDDDLIIPAPDPSSSPIISAGSNDFAPDFGDKWTSPWRNPPTIGAIEP